MGLATKNYSNNPLKMKSSLLKVIFPCSNCPFLFQSHSRFLNILAPVIFLNLIC